MKKGFLNSKMDADEEEKKEKSSWGNMAVDSSKPRVKFLWSGSVETASSKPTQWGWNGCSSSSIRTELRSQDYTSEHELFDPSSAKRTDHNSSNNNKSMQMSCDSTVNKKESSSFKNTPILPNKTQLVPKNTLSSWYGKHHKKTAIRNAECFRTWSNGGPAHLLQWTSIFTCPVSKEKFPSGSFGDPKSYTKVYQNQGSQSSYSEAIAEKSDLPSTTSESTNDNDKKDKDSSEINIDETSSEDKSEPEDKEAGIVWFTRKINAEHAAAARALDCLNFRENRYFKMSCKPIRLCKERPTDAPDPVVVKQIGQEEIRKRKIDQLQVNNAKTNQNFRAQRLNKSRGLGDTGRYYGNNNNNRMQPRHNSHPPYNNNTNMNHSPGPWPMNHVPQGPPPPASVYVSQYQHPVNPKMPMQQQGPPCPPPPPPQQQQQGYWPQPPPPPPPPRRMNEYN